MYCRCTVRNIAGLVPPLQRTYAARWNLSFVSNGPTLLFSFPYVRGARIRFGHSVWKTTKYSFVCQWKLKLIRVTLCTPYLYSCSMDVNCQARTELQTETLKEKSSLFFLLFRSGRLDDVFTFSFTNDNFSCNCTILLSLLTSVVERSPFSLSSSTISSTSKGKKYRQPWEWFVT